MTDANVPLSVFLVHKLFSLSFRASFPRQMKRIQLLSGQTIPDAILAHLSFSVSFFFNTWHNSGARFR